jgi:hypothetical protein
MLGRSAGPIRRSIFNNPSVRARIESLSNSTFSRPGWHSPPAMCLVDEILRTSPVVPLLQPLTSGRPEVLENHLWTSWDSDDGQV